MGKYRVMAEKTIFVAHFKEFEAETMEAAEALAEAEVEGLTMRQELPDLGWSIGDESSLYEIRHDATEELTERER